MLAMTHQAEQFDIIIPISNPYSIGLDFIQSVHPSVQPNLHMLVGSAIEVARDDLSSYELVLVVFLKGLADVLLG